MNFRRLVFITITLLQTAGLLAKETGDIKGGHKKFTARIRTHVSYLEDGDSVNFILSTGKIATANERKVYKVKVVNHSLNLLIDSLTTVRNVIFLFKEPDGANGYRSFIVEPGDSVVMDFVDGNWRFSGINSDKYECITRVNEMLGASPRTGFPRMDKEGANLNNLRAFISEKDSIAENALKLLDEFRSNLSITAYTYISNMIVTSCEEGKIIPIRLFSRTEDDAFIYADYLKDYKSPIWKGGKALADSLLLAGSDNQFMDCILDHYWFDSCIMMKRYFDISNCYYFIKKSYSGKLRERLEFWLITKYKDKSQNSLGCINDALKYLRNEDFRKKLIGLKSTRLPGAPAYNFALENESGKMVRLSDFSGKVVIMDFWYTGCGNCAQLYPYMDSIQHLYEGRKVVLVSVNIDEKKETWLHSIKGGKYTSKNPSSQLVNLYTNGQAANHPIIKHYFISGYPTIILIDKNGKVLPNPVDPRGDGGRSLVSIVNASLNAMQGSSMDAQYNSRL